MVYKSLPIFYNITYKQFAGQFGFTYYVNVHLVCKCMWFSRSYAVKDRVHIYIVWKKANFSSESIKVLLQNYIVHIMFKQLLRFEVLHKIGFSSGKMSSQSYLMIFGSIKIVCIAVDIRNSMLKYLSVFRQARYSTVKMFAMKKLTKLNKYSNICKLIGTCFLHWLLDYL